ncbi:Hydroxyacylglutathione hydrolase [Candidatus Lokiarchaeum ossiferum]|uniref:Hydroxyacylglutathione hydrolase n=1 Tax=Candidatus Lokiarchaeum ossiferum TaxID=2951803 RepID=A0ABY6HQQ9_9ARCH|nr:Hydroxyacylglutathione hydrolase [Candidatus Lokiarchaeum sp. B-35]
MMEVSQLESNILLYTFKEGYGVNIVALIHENHSCLIDIGNEQQALQVKRHLAREGITVTDVFFSHLHSDHCFANSLFANCQIHCGKNYKENFADNVNDPTFIPQNLHQDGDLFQFGTHSLQILETPGHSSGSISIILNNKYMIVGDLLIFDYEGHQYLPYVGADSTFQLHFDNVSRIKSLPYHVLIPGHGLIQNSQESIQKACEVVEFYLKQLEKLGKDAKLGELIKDPTNILSTFHEMTLTNQFSV